jgi:hypothetical protein
MAGLRKWDYGQFVKHTIIPFIRSLTSMHNPSPKKLIIPIRVTIDHTSPWDGASLLKHRRNAILKTVRSVSIAKWLRTFYIVHHSFTEFLRKGGHCEGKH